MSSREHLCPRCGREWHCEGCHTREVVRDCDSCAEETKVKYKREIPRDLFNEAKLLKQLGKIELIINHTGPNKIGLKSEWDREPFDIRQDQGDGSIFVANYHLMLDGEEIHLYNPLNAREDWPMMARYKGEDYYMFNNKGEIMPNFGKVDV